QFASDVPNNFLEERFYQKQQLIRIARPFMIDLHRFFSGSEFQVVLTDEDGLLLEVIGDRQIVSRTREVHLCPGANWSESAMGTNAIGTALVERAPVQIYAWEHFCARNQFLTCSAAPICDADGKVIGCIDISGDHRQANPHTMAMVVAAVRAIEYQLRLEQATHKLYVASRYSKAVGQGIAEGLIAIDRDGIVTDINARGGEIFGVNPATVKGRAFSTVCTGNALLLKVLKDGKEYENQELIVERSGKRIRSSGSPIRDESGDIVGAIAFFQEVADRNLRSGTAPVVYSHRHTLEDICGDSPTMKVAKEWAYLATTCNSTVLITGESGTGKELFANAIHNGSPRARGPFIAINCAAIPETLIESELFGYVDGSFTGAKKGGQPGKFEMANGGSIFLDEIGEMSFSVQAKLLRVLQQRTITRIGSAKEIEVDIRIIAATHRDLNKDVAAGRFREDLYYRLAVLEVKVPPLRERPQDIPALVNLLITKISARLQKHRVTVDSECMRRMCAHSWPGNVRALENVLERALVCMGDAHVLRVEHLGLASESAVPVTNAELPSRPEKPHSEAAIRSLRDVERDAIAEALSACCGNIKKAAARLGIARNTLYRKMEDYGLVVESDKHTESPHDQL
ncbi:MAG TPA: sigma 54-interacting transcriptional regulator, partial [Candidatus Acidoferrales bacterium]|nr:sigma 54-interacting transcriptional regulator [Candidatus Acidoferrales bacterium]